MKFKRFDSKRHNISLVFATAILLYVNVVDVKAINMNAGRDGWNALKIGVGARAPAMGDTFVAVADDVNSIYWNPSALGRLSRPQFSAMHSCAGVCGIPCAFYHRCCPGLHDSVRHSSFHLRVHIQVRSFCQCATVTTGSIAVEPAGYVFSDI